MPQASMARGISSGPSDPEYRHAPPPNLIVEPKYSDHEKDLKTENDSGVSPQKLQYEPITPEVPVLQEKEGEVERSNGAEYQKGRELYIAPKADNVVKDEEIHEKEGDKTQECASFCKIAKPPLHH